MPRQPFLTPLWGCQTKLAFHTISTDAPDKQTGAFSLGLKGVTHHAK
jgi:hypothetical protein